MSAQGAPVSPRAKALYSFSKWLTGAFFINLEYELVSTFFRGKKGLYIKEFIQYL